ncbi:hypothetical protein E4634_10885 [Mangrovimicrobium sediminis]|uniref:Uncharacterized protein n=1 Tax=Mangrovimicrobium sediminis TaxID=2562682 RepID=A0A4Z0M2K8_9GAMM|nr:hypothetical protein [Haliea sp. SAOS-164]TGD73525.1 hypothetical protein E4634_10885 [Haliea sp. SAOS-164]
MKPSVTILAGAGLFLLASVTRADLKPDILECDAEKAARNAAMEATVGVHGRCDPKRLADKKKEAGKDHLDDARDKAGDKLDNAKDDLDDKAHSLKRD